MFMVIIGTILEWVKTKHNLQLLPILAYFLSILSFISPYEEGFAHPWVSGFAWLVMGLVVRIVVMRRQDQDKVD
jgi:hypothetical protein